MKKFLALSAAASLAVVVSSPAMAECAYGAHASKKHDMTIASSTDDQKVEEAMTTFDSDVLDGEKKEELKPVESE